MTEVLSEQTQPYPTAVIGDHAIVQAGVFCDQNLEPREENSIKPDIKNCSLNSNQLVEAETGLACRAILSTIEELSG